MPSLATSALRCPTAGGVSVPLIVPFTARHLQLCKWLDALWLHWHNAQAKDFILPITPSMELQHLADLNFRVGFTLGVWEGGIGPCPLSTASGQATPFVVAMVMQLQSTSSIKPHLITEFELLGMSAQDSICMIPCS